ncbi:X-Pro aminopeptidase [Candidatus Liberibacter solanacearum]|uniref:Xaa-Pro aminopeptidase n=1 Tax=Candidatus Liberibacter solanacearum TaxID=556287 RepID=A0A094YZ91_9HYPH|nr:aminopeptidase P family protein [Candidatus Liberibacter solanacearum]KGB27260.1 X-Pro aminopeptidase [Candidatus Liberibacter solanacearum]KJZ80843.1 X-Pro aminopeptidase [Candidatus Liberibacter solanacearum]KJZ81977.1 Xaa-Pro aminopeptidase [Candidatus Liberibacter solanacearum]KQC49587.1 X-Pro aminopeptidase [Candidatus Liberibacter solanacearum]
MFQSFEVQSSSQKSFERIKNLRSCFDQLGIDAFLIPRADEYRGEFVSSDSERLAWISGFTGSAGIAVVLRQEAFIFVDGRYVVQVEQEVDTTLFTIKNITIEPLHVWILDNALSDLRLGLDSRLHSMSEVALLQKSLDKTGGIIVDLPYNPLDRLWEDRPHPLHHKIAIQDIAYAGKSSQEKIRDICKNLNEKQVAAVLICDPSSVAWIFNIRGFDISCAPYPLSRAILYANGKADIFIDKQYINEELRVFLSAVAVPLDMDMIDLQLMTLARTNMPILIDPTWIPYRFFKVISQENGVVVAGPDPSYLLRAVKNKVEIEGMRLAHIQDGVAMVCFLSWLDSRNLGTITEIDVVKKLENYREEIGRQMHNPLLDIAFNTIAASGPHAAIIHYRVTTQSNRILQGNELFLLDSGAQYVNGTTDITRTIAIGHVDHEKKYYFTLVLKGMIAISNVIFPPKTRGCDLDSIARLFLWKAGVDFAHGVGHGIGSFLPVHEGPQGISRMNQQPLLSGMILSNEPGYYKYNDFGIRIENVLCVTDPIKIDGGECLMLGFNTLTLCPIDRRLILVELLTNEEKKWLNDYHSRVYKTLMPLIDDPKVLSWLLSATLPI